nr:hypothetical protein [uncultured Pseudomonas sp.]
MPYKILMWNTQHLNNQSKNESEAYQAKATYLIKVLLLRRPDLLALFETGTTGTPNVSVERLLNAQGYQLVHALDNEGGIRIDTTLGSMVFVRNELAGAFQMLPGYVLGASERRAPIIIRHRYNHDALAFYHANSSYKAVEMTAETINFIVENKGASFRELIFFGGDLNASPHENHKIIHPRGHKPLQPNYPPIAGTHIQIINKTRLQARRDWRLNVDYVYDFDQGIDVPVQPLEHWEKRLKWDEAITEDEYVAVPRVLDYAYVTDTYRWNCECDGYAAGTPNGSGGFKAIRRISHGEVIRSDHFPVFYFGKRHDEEAMFLVHIAEDPYLSASLRNRLGAAEQPVTLRFGSFKSSPVVMEAPVGATYWAWANTKTLRVASSTNLVANFRYKKQTGVAWPAILEFPSFSGPGGSGAAITLYVTGIDYQ